MQKKQKVLNRFKRVKTRFIREKCTFSCCFDDLKQISLTGCAHHAQSNTNTNTNTRASKKTQYPIQVKRAYWMGNIWIVDVRENRIETRVVQAVCLYCTGNSTRSSSFVKLESCNKELLTKRCFRGDFTRNYTGNS